MFLIPACDKTEPNDEASSKADAPGQEGTSAQSEAPTGSGWSMVTLVDGTPVFGHLSESSLGGLFVLDEAFFLAGGDSADINTLRPFGAEIHRPLQVLIVPRSSVLYEEPLTGDAPAVTAIAEYQAANPTTAPVVPDFQAGAHAAVFLRTGEVFFGRLVIEGESARLTGAHFLRFKEEGASDAGEITSLDQVELIPEAQAAAGSTGEMIIPMESVLYFQPLAGDSPVTSILTAQ